MSKIHHPIRLDRLANGDIVTSEVVRIVDGQPTFTSNTGEVSNLTSRTIGKVTVYRFALVEADGTEIPMAGLDSWTLTLHTPFWPDFNEQHGGMMRAWLATDLDMYRTWSRIMQIDGITRQEMVDRYVECLITGETVVPQDREAYYQLINA